MSHDMFYMSDCMTTLVGVDFSVSMHSGQMFASVVYHGLLTHGELLRRDFRILEWFVWLIVLEFDRHVSFADFQSLVHHS